MIHIDILQDSVFFVIKQRLS